MCPTMQQIVLNNKNFQYESSLNRVSIYKSSIQFQQSKYLQNEVFLLYMKTKMKPES